MTEALELLARNELPSIPQDDSKATHAAQLEKDDGRIRWQETAKQISDRFRGVIAYPGSWTTLKGDVLKIHDLAIQNIKGQAGKILAVSKEGVLVGTGEGSILLKTVQPASKPKMSAHDWANGYRINTGDELG
jgi:methionyl-tRNA formyltransferase